MMFGARLQEAMAAHGPLCVGIDPHDHLLDAWGLPRTVEGVREFSLRTVAELTGEVAAVKPQSAFYERFGSAGVAVLEETLAACREAGLISVLDIKRGDIGSTMAAYARAYLDPDSPLAADAITVSPYLGVGALNSAFDLAAEHGKGIFVLALTSNPEGAEVQHARRGSADSLGGQSVAGTVIAEVAARNAEVARGTAAVAARGAEAAGGTAEAAARDAAAAGGEALGPFGLVVGATIGSAARDLGVDPTSCGGPILAPGVGFQGAGEAELTAVFGSQAIAANQILATASRAVLAAGPEGLVGAAKDLTARLTGRG